jgi:hypothetical protein
MQSIIKEIKLSNIIINNYIYPVDYLQSDDYLPYYDWKDKFDRYNLERSKFLCDYLLNNAKRFNNYMSLYVNIKYFCKNKTYEMEHGHEWIWF